MKKLILLVAIATALTATIQTSSAQSIRKFLGGVSPRKASIAQLERAYDRALAANPGSALSLLDQLLRNPKIKDNPSAILSAAQDAMAANPDLAAFIFFQTSWRVGADNLLALTNSALESPAVKSNPDIAADVFRSALFGAGEGNIELKIQLAEAVVDAVPETELEVSQAIASNTGGVVNSNEV